MTAPSFFAAKKRFCEIWTTSDMFSYSRWDAETGLRPHFCAPFLRRELRERVAGELREAVGVYDAAP